MTLRKFDSAKVKVGDTLVLSRFPNVELTFKFMGFDGDIVGTWVYPDPTWPNDVILHQRDVMMVCEE